MHIIFKWQKPKNKEKILKSRGIQNTLPIKNKNKNYI